MKRELLGYFRSPVAYVFIVIFLAALAGCTFSRQFLSIKQASLEVFLLFIHGYFFLIPAIGNALVEQRKKVEERSSFLFTLPITMEEKQCWASLPPHGFYWDFSGNTFQ